MNAEVLLIIMIGLITFNYLFSTILNFINDKNWKEDIPENMKEFYSKKHMKKQKIMPRKKVK